MRIVCVPGFTQSAATWDATRAALPAEHVSVALELPDGLDFVATAHALGEGGGRAMYVGYSLGGRLCLRLASDRPELVEALVLVSATPGIEDDAERAARRESDEQLAREVERDGVEAFIDRWLAQPLFATLPADAAGRDQRIRANTPARLAHQLRALGQGAQEPLWERLEEIELPVALVTGLADAKYDAIAEAMFERLDDCLHVRLDAGHAVPLEQPAALADLLVRFVHDVTA